MHCRRLSPDCLGTCRAGLQCKLVFVEANRTPTGFRGCRHARCVVKGDVRVWVAIRVSMLHNQNRSLRIYLNRKFILYYFFFCKNYVIKNKLCLYKTKFLLKINDLNINTKFITKIINLCIFIVKYLI